jgi:predicted anti-sigma-YlaC factor YlaD
MRWNNRRSGTGPSSGTASLPLDETSCRAEEPACITGVMASSESAAIPRSAGLPLVRRGHARWLVRAPGQRGALSPEEAAHALKAKRAELRRSLDWRRDVAGIPEHVRDELVDEAIGLVVMSSKPIRDEQHLQGAFWTSIGYLLMEHRSGRRDLHVGSHRRVEFEPVAEVLPGDDDEPFDLVAAQERIATAADLMAQLDPFEQQVMAVMAAHGLGVKRAAKAMGEPIKTVLAAYRSAQRKLDQVAAITVAGRLCDYRQQAIHAHVQGTAQAEQEKAARAHLAACAGCRSSYATLVREMRGREFQRAASAAFLPPPALAVELHSRWIERLTSLLSTGRAPSGTATAERTAGVLGGGGLVKAAAVTSAIAVAGAGVGAKVVHSLESTAPVHHHTAASHPATSTPAASIVPAITGTIAGGLTSTYTTSTKPAVTPPAKHHHSVPAPPSHADGYLALGGSTGESTHEPSATVATVPATTESPEPAPEPAPQTQTGGGTNLNYLGH